MKTKYMIKKIHLILLLQMLVMVSSCQVFKNNLLKKDPPPEWISMKPQNSMYYTGVSSAPKSGYMPADYQANAQQKALGDLASSISVNIESTSVLSIIELNYNINENFSSEITASTNQQLEGYELVDTWEDGDYYWVYYRLSKSKYQTQKIAKKEQAILDAKNKYYQARELLGRQLHYNAFQFYVEAITSLKPYLGESTLTDIDGEEKDLGNEVFGSIADFVNGLEIIFSDEQIEVKKGVDIDSDVFSFTIVDSNGNPVSSIPVKVRFTGTGLLRNSEVSSNDGKVYCAIRKVKSEPNVETLSVHIDMLSFSRAAKDHMVRSLIKNIPATETTVRVKVVKPYLQITSVEQMIDEPRSDKRLQTSLEGLLSSDFGINGNEKPDFKLHLTSNTVKDGEYYGEAQVTINYTIDLTDASGSVVYRKTKSNEYTGADYESASNKAYVETAKSIERTIAREIISAVNK